MDRCENLYEALSSLIVGQGTFNGAFVSVTGGGGKTTLMVNLASFLKNQGKKVLITTTTKLMSPYLHDYGADFIFKDDKVLDFVPSKPCAVFYAMENSETNKWHSPQVSKLEILKKLYDAVICEADGSRQLPFKLHTQRDPQIPLFNTFTIAVAGLWGIGKKARDVVFGEDMDAVLDRSYLNRYINTEQGLLKGSSAGARAIVFNGAEDFSELSLLRNLDYPEDVSVFAAAEKTGVIYEKIQ